MKCINNNTKLIVCAAGIFICYFYFGILQEKITHGVYVDDNDNNEKFTYMVALVFIQCIINCSFAKILLMIFMKEGEDNTKIIYYTSSALFYLLAMVFSNKALQFISYPTQVVGKAGKPIPVMILGVLLGKKSYPMKKYVFVLLIVLGVILFSFKDEKILTNQSEQFGIGEVLLILSLILDGLMGAVEERMRSEHKTKSGHMMLNMNFWSFIFSGFVIISTGELFEFIKFLQRYPISFLHIMTLSLAGALGQFFIFLTIAEFGPLPCSIITTIRKFFTVLGSVLLFGNSLSIRQWIGTSIVFAGLFLDAAYGEIKSNDTDTVEVNAHDGTRPTESNEICPVEDKIGPTDSNPSR